MPISPVFTPSKILPLLTILLLSLVASQCRMLSDALDSSDLMVTSIDPPAKYGNKQRCDQIYPDMYRVSTDVVAAIISRSQDMEKGELDPPIVPDTNVAKSILTYTRLMLLNLMRSSERPIHPVAFFSVVKDFESTLDMDEWSSGHKFIYTGELCTSGTCSGYFQVDVDIEPLWNLSQICGSHGLNILGLKGSTDFCAFLFWFHGPGDGTKCRLINAGDPCRDPSYVWTPDTFAKAGMRAYRQGNPWADHPYYINDPWGKIYTGLHHGGEFHHGYEHCSMEYYLKNYWSAPQDWRAPADLSNYSKVIQAAVRQYGYEIGLLPPWAAPDWTPNLEPPQKDGGSREQSGFPFPLKPTTKLMELIQQAAPKKHDNGIFPQQNTDNSYKQSSPHPNRSERRKTSSATPNAPAGESHPASLAPST